MIHNGNDLDKLCCVVDDFYMVKLVVLILVKVFCEGDFYLFHIKDLILQFTLIYLCLICAIILHEKIIILNPSSTFSPMITNSECITMLGKCSETNVETDYNFIR